MSSWLTAIRIARREARRARGRSALVVALLGLPVLVLTFAMVSYDSFRLTFEQELDRTMGAADAVVTWEFDAPVVQSTDGENSAPAGTDPGVDAARRLNEADLRAVLPVGSRVVPVQSSELELRTATGIGRLAAEGADLTDPVHAGRLVLREGRAPATNGEVALTKLATRRLGASIGETIHAADGSGSWTVVGIAEFPERFREAIVLHPGAVDFEPASWLVDAPAPVSWDQVLALNRHGVVVRSRAVLLDPPPLDQVHEDYQFEREAEGPPEEVGLFAGPAMLEVGLLAAAAFAVGARRRARQLALVAVSGGRPAHQRRIMLADGLVLGLAGAAIGIGLGSLVVALGMPLLEEHLYGRPAGGFRLPLPSLAGLGGLAVVTGLLAALVPAIVAGRQSVVAGLASRRGVTRSKKRWLVLGLALIGLGAGMAGLGAGQTNYGLVAGGLVTGQLGLVLCTPALIGLVARAGRFLPLGPRIALRDTARNRAAAAPAVTAVMAVVAGTLMIGIYAISDLSRLHAASAPGIAIGSAAVYYDLQQPGVDRSLAELHDQVLASVKADLPSARVAEVWQTNCAPGTEAGAFCVVRVPVPEQNACPWESLERELTAGEQRAAARDERCRDTGTSLQGGFGFDIVDDGTALPGLTGASGDDLAGATAVLRAGGVVVTDPRAVADGQATVEVATYLEGGVEPARAERVTVPGYALSTKALGPVYLSLAAAERAGLGTHPAGLVVRQEGGFTVAEEDAANAVLRTIDPNLGFYVERGQPDLGPRRLVLAAIAAGLVMLAAAAVATGLAAADRRPDLATLGAVGASPRVRRLLSLSQCGVIAGLGALLGTAAGLGGAFGVLSALNQRYANTWPVYEPPYPLEVPWAALAILLVAVPVAAMLGAGLLTRSRLPIERRP